MRLMCPFMPPQVTAERYRQPGQKRGKKTKGASRIALDTVGVAAARREDHAFPIVGAGPTHIALLDNAGMTKVSPWSHLQSPSKQ